MYGVRVSVYVQVSVYKQYSHLKTQGNIKPMYQCLSVFICMESMHIRHINVFLLQNCTTWILRITYNNMVNTVQNQVGMNVCAYVHGTMRSICFTYLETYVAVRGKSGSVLNKW